jgi:hypothetical protein
MYLWIYKMVFYNFGDIGVKEVELHSESKVWSKNYYEPDSQLSFSYLAAYIF